MNHRRCTAEAAKNAVVSKVDGKKSRLNGNGGTSHVGAEKRGPLAADDIDLFRDTITGLIFADPVFCDRGHTHERSCMERHFRARQEMQAERSVQVAGDSCNAEANFGPTCPYTNEPISDILISNQQCDRLVVALIASGAMSVSSEELDYWNSRREAKAKATAQSGNNDTSTHESVSETASLPPPVNADAVEIIGEPQVLNESDRVSLGLAVALCPSSFQRQHCSWTPRCSNPGCQSLLLDTHANRHSCGRCARVHCESCIPFQVIEYDPNRLERSHAMICADCVFQIVDVLWRSHTNATTISRLEGILTSFFEMVSRKQIQLQYDILHYDMHREFLVVQERMAADLEVNRERLALLQKQVCNAHFQSERPRPKAVIHSRDTDTKKARVNGHIGVMELNAAKRSQWMRDRKRASKVKIERERVLDAERTIDSLTKQKIECQARLEAVKREHDNLEQQGPSDAHDVNYCMRLSELTHDFETLSQQALQLKRRKPPLQLKAPAREPCPNRARANNASSFESESEEQRPQFDLFSIDSSRNAQAHAVENQPSGRAATDTHDTETLSRSSSGEDRCYPSNLGVLTEKPVLTTQTVVVAVSTLEALRKAQITDCLHLPLGLSFPSIQMTNKIITLRDQLELAHAEAHRTLDARYSGYQQRLEKLIDTVQDEILVLERGLSKTRGTEMEVKVQDERRARQTRAHDHHLKMEQERLAAEQTYREERERIETARFQQEHKTRDALRDLDLRRCGRCGYGPFEKFACNDMNAHNDAFSWMDANGVRQRRRRNECPQCKWTHSDWNEWPRFTV